MLRDSGLGRGPRIKSKGAKTGNFLSSGGALMIWASISWAGAGASGQPPLPPNRPPSSSETPPGGGTPPARAPSVATPLTPQPGDAAACFAELRANHVEAEIVPAPPAPLADCEIAEPVRLSSIGLANGATIDLPGHPILDCAFALTFTEFARDLMRPAAAGRLAGCCNVRTRRRTSRGLFGRALG
jgi:hypothetical protein